MSSILQTLQGCLSGTQLTLPADAFGAGGIADVVAEYFGDQLVVDQVSLVAQGDSVTFENARVVSAPLAGMTVSAVFAPGPGGGAPTMSLTATPPAGWTFASGWPLLAGSWIAGVGLPGAQFSLVSAAGNGLAKGLNLATTLQLGTAWQAALWLLGGSPTVTVSGAIGQTGGVPTFDFSAPIADAPTLPVLGQLGLTLRLQCSAISGAVQPPGGGGNLPLLAAAGDGPIVVPWVPQARLGLAATLPLTAQVSVPVFIDLTTPQDAIAIRADVSQVGLVGFAEFAQLLPGVDFGSVLPSSGQYNPGTVFTLRTLDFLLLPASRSIANVGIALGTTAPWTVTHGLAVGPITLQFQYQPGANALSVSLLGTVGFDGGALQLGAYYPGFTFTGSLAPDSHIDLIALMQRLLPIQLNATLYLDEFDIVVQPASGAFSLTTGLSGDWSIPVGLATIDLTGAWLQLDRSNGQTSGAIGMQGQLAISGQPKPITFQGSWTLPGSFAMQAQFPALSLTRLVDTLTGGSLPDGVPDIALDDGALAVALNTGTGDYGFSLAATAAVNGSSLGSGVFQVRRSGGSTGYLVGYVIPQAWSPAQIWSGLGDLFGGLSFSDSGLVISSLPAGSAVALPNMTMPSLPATVNPGFTFFSTLSLDRGILGPLAGLFSDAASFKLLAVVDTANPMNSVFQALFAGDQGTNAVRFTGIAVTLKPGAQTLSLSAGAVLTIQDDAITLKGTGTLGLAPPSASFTIEIDHWDTPFGIQGLSIDTFGLQVGIAEAGVTIGFLGAFVIGTAPRSFKLVIGGELIDFEAPGAIIFELVDNDPSNPLMLSDIIGQFTQLDLSHVPVLNAIGFDDLEFWVVDDPAGFKIGDYTFPPGIGLVADIFIYDWEAKFNLQVSWGKGIIAAGSINLPISLAGGLFTLSDVSGQKGPSGSIDTSALPGRSPMLQARTRLLPRSLGHNALVAAGSRPYMTLDGKVQFLGITQSVLAQASASSFEFQLAFDFLGIVQATLNCALQDATHFSAAAGIGFNLDVTLGPYAVAGVTLIPRIHIDGPAAALSLGITINPQVIAQLSLHLKFAWASLPLFDLQFTLSVADIAHDLTRLYSAMVTWLENNVGQVFADLLSDVEAWIDAVKNVFTEIGQDIDAVANALANYFKTAVDDAAAFLKDLGFAFESIVEALVSYFKIAFDEAVKIVEGLWNDCSLSNAFDAAEPATRAAPPLRALQYALTRSPAGQRLLLLRHGYGDEIWRLLGRRPALRQRLAALDAAPHGCRDLRAAIDTALAALVEVAPRASPALRAEIDLAIVELHQRRHLEPARFIESFAA